VAGNTSIIEGTVQEDAELIKQTASSCTVPEGFTDTCICGWKYFYIEGTVQEDAELKMEGIQCR